MSDATKHIYTVGTALWDSVNVGGAAPAVVELRDRMTRPRPGDLVIEVSSFRGYDPDGVGTLTKIERDDPEFPDRYVIEPLDKPGEEQGWRNSRFIALPTDRPKAWLRQPDPQEDR